MVLSDDNKPTHKSSLSESPPLNASTTSGSKTYSSQRSWARIVTKNGKSLLHSSSSLSATNIAGPTSIDNDMPTFFKSSIWCPEHGPGSAFLNMTGRKEAKIELLILIAQQYLSREGVLTQQVGALKFAEINFYPADKVFNECLTNSVKFAENSLIIPCRAMDNHMQVVRLCLSNLPFLGEKALLESLQKSLRKYGDILYVVILLEPTTSTYMCTSFAVLNVSSKDTQFENLTHLIPWDEQRECGFYAVWNQMPVYCRYCHEEGHVVANCPKRRIKHTCWTCGAVNHLAAECSRDKPSKKARKQPAAIFRPSTSVESSEITPPMEQFVTTDKDIVPEEPMTDSSVDSDATTLQAPIVDSLISSYAVTVPALSNVAIAATSRSKRLTILVKKVSIRPSDHSNSPYYVTYIGIQTGREHDC
ncbi:hypothetical protein G6F46_002570 [Rhizopus delemar]|uniref:CCHC-type domain-containing protein n=2 Tax=Rhizopus TaxID=4842 RepID=A0A9P6ZCN8_9FUNG|nr:hypothetical protein G6F55_001727 [Rhizopus delemar]KAG1550035.1 hypothetical protein G6F51_002697 [Rhizopus arrhizus]KAG1503019.1 hypothetical protein G6F54_001960 [Rhizopus delemar]KAG1516503.1 hypothetical protein G6F53_002110 [Rhizopus delemar]KAG1528481.1 hypothetical protein G6F52_000611 [Rhizopus delemar]